MILLLLIFLFVLSLLVWLCRSSSLIRSATDCQLPFGDLDLNSKRMIDIFRHIFKFALFSKNRKFIANSTHLSACCSDIRWFCRCFVSAKLFDSTYVFTGNNLWLFRLDCSVDANILLLLAADARLDCSSFIYKILSELWRCGVRTRELCTINCDVEPENEIFKKEKTSSYNGDQW